MISNSAFLVSAKYSSASRALMMVAGGTYDTWLNSAAAAKEMNRDQIIESKKENDSWLREILDPDPGVSTGKALIKEGIYATPTVKVGKLAEQMLPHLDAAMNTMAEFLQLFGIILLQETLQLLMGQEKAKKEFRDELQFANLMQQSLRMYFMMRGTAMPGDRMIETYFNEMMQRYDKPTISFQKHIQKRHTRFGKQKDLANKKIWKARIKTN